MLFKVAGRQFASSSPLLPAARLITQIQDIKQKKKVSQLCKLQNDRKRVLSLNFELLHIELEIIKECDRHRNEDLFSRSKGFQAFSMRNKAFSHSYVLLFVYFHFSLVIFFSSTSISFRISPLSRLYSFLRLLLISGLYKALCFLWCTTKFVYCSIGLGGPLYVIRLTFVSMQIKQRSQ